MMIWLAAFYPMPRWWTFVCLAIIGIFIVVGVIAIIWAIRWQRRP